MSPSIWKPDQKNHVVWTVRLDPNQEDKNPFEIMGELCSSMLAAKCDSAACNLMNIGMTIVEKPNTSYSFALIHDERFPVGMTYEAAREMTCRGDFTKGKKARMISSSGAVRLLKLLLSTNHPLSGDVVLMLEHQSIDQHDCSTTTLMYRNFHGHGKIMTQKLYLDRPLPAGDWHWYVVELIEE